MTLLSEGTDLKQRVSAKVGRTKSLISSVVTGRADRPSRSAPTNLCDSLKNKRYGRSATGGFEVAAPAIRPSSPPPPPGRKEHPSSNRLYSGEHPDDLASSSGLAISVPFCYRLITQTVFRSSLRRGWAWRIRQHPLFPCGGRTPRGAGPRAGTIDRAW